MRPSAVRPDRLCVVLSLILVSGFGVGAAQAQDVFAMLEAHSAMSAQAQYAADAHARYSERYDDDRDSSRSAPMPRLTPEELKRLDAESRERQIEEEARSQRWLKGSWEFFQSRVPAGPGEYCSAMYQGRDGMITLGGLDKRWGGALLMFTGENIPKPRKFREITATLTQTGDAPAKVKVFNYARDPGMDPLGTLVFAVPTMDAALAGMTDELEFAIAIDDKEVFRMAWKDGRKAADELRKCVRMR